MTVVHRRTPSFRIKPEKESAAFFRNLKEDGTAVTQASTTTLNLEQGGNNTELPPFLLEAGREK